MYFYGNGASSPIGPYRHYKFVNHHGHFTYDPATQESEARLWGYIENYADPTNNVLATGSAYKKIRVDIVLQGRPGNQPNGAGPYGTPQADWRYYDYVSGRLEVLEGTNAGQVIELQQWNTMPAFQVGTGANIVDSTFGSASWFNWRVVGTSTWQSGDISNTLTPCVDPSPSSVPSPSPSPTCSYDTDCTAEDDTSCQPSVCDASS